MRIGSMAPRSVAVIGLSRMDLDSQTQPVILDFGQQQVHTIPMERYRALCYPYKTTM